jgi:aromatic ring-cleaving dioxygenase
VVFALGPRPLENAAELAIVSWLELSRMGVRELSHPQPGTSRGDFKSDHGSYLISCQAIIMAVGRLV